MLIDDDNENMDEIENLEENFVGIGDDEGS